MAFSEYMNFYVKYRGPILRVTWPALGSDDLNIDQVGTSIQITTLMKNIVKLTIG